MEIIFINDMIWYTTSANLFVLMWLTAYMYKSIKDATFLYYSLYCFFLLLYAITRNDFLRDLFLHFFPKIVLVTAYWYTQVLFYTFLFLFSFKFLNIQKYYPKILYHSKRILFTNGIIGTLLVVYSLVTTNVKYLSLFYTYIYVPILAVLGIFVITISIKIPEKSKSYFLVAISVYALFALIGFYEINIYNFLTVLSPNSLFFLGVIIEGNVFAFGLAKRTKNISVERIAYQKTLAKTEETLKLALEEKLRLTIERKEKLELEKRINDLHLKVISSQMNSHFLFNVLNSIKFFVIDNDVRKATDFINRFSKYIRQILIAERDTSHTLGDEITTTINYLEIEKMRLQNNFSYELINNLSAQDSNILFPNHILQPFVENAIWHGLMPKNGDKKLCVTLNKQQDKIKIKIEDNGIGLEKSKDIKTNKNKGHQSEGLKIIQERIRLFNEKELHQIQFAIVDKKSPYVDSKGVIVILEITPPILKQNSTNNLS